MNEGREGVRKMTEKETVFDVLHPNICHVSQIISLQQLTLLPPPLTSQDVTFAAFKIYFSAPKELEYP